MKAKTVRVDNSQIEQAHEFTHALAFVLDYRKGKISDEYATTTSLAQMIVDYIEKVNPIEDADVIQKYFEDKIMDLSGKDKDDDTWVETRNAFVIFRSSMKKFAMEQEYYKPKVEFYRQQTDKLRKYIDENKLGKPNEKFFDILYNHIQELKSTTERESLPEDEPYQPTTEDVAVKFMNWVIGLQLETVGLCEPFDAMTDKELFTYFIENIYKKEQP